MSVGAALRRQDASRQQGGTMSQASGPNAGRSIIRNQQDFYGGLVLVGVALIAFWASRKLPGQQGFAFGPGTSPRLFAGLLAIAGAAVAVIGLVTDGAKLERYAIRGPLLVTAAIILFAVTVRPLGLVISSYITIVLAAMGSAEFRWGEALIWAAVLTVFCTVLFLWGLGLPMQPWPRWY
jgi:putative tricarboxylic transport membrane protein